MDIENQSEYPIRQLALDEIKKLYDTNMQQDFPAPEIKPYGMIEGLYYRGLNKAHGLWEKAETELSAYAIFEEAHQGNVWLLDYFAVDGRKRGTGLGSIFLNRLGELLRETTEVDAVFLEIERVEKAVSEEQRLIRELCLKIH